jgi:hypothetical protein
MPLQSQGLRGSMIKVSDSWSEHVSLPVTDHLTCDLGQVTLIALLFEWDVKPRFLVYFNVYASYRQAKDPTQGVYV